MPVSAPGEAPAGHRLIRRVLCVRGEMRLAVEVDPRFDYGRAPHDVELADAGRAPPSAIRASAATTRCSPRAPTPAR